MSFSAEWLALREPADRVARDPGLLGGAVAAARAAAGGARPVIVDLGCGTGATARAFAAAGLEAEWRLVDADPALLALAEADCGGRPFRLDLREIDALPLEGAHLVTASALLDLMPRGWVARLAARLGALGLGFYAALSYDGAMAWAPELPEDAAVTAAFNRHQLGDKGLGPALGPQSGAVAAGLFAAAGHATRLARSPWRLGPGEAALQGALLDGIAAAAAEAGFAGAEAWRQARRAACGYAACTVGHSDLLALPRARPTAQSNRMSEPSA